MYSDESNHGDNQFSGSESLARRSLSEPNLDLSCYALSLNSQPNRQWQLILEGLLQDNISPRTSNEDLLTHLIAAGMLQRLYGDAMTTNNMYELPFELPQTTMFYAMAEAIPLVRVGHQTANWYLSQSLADVQYATLLDIGIGQGIQLQMLLESLKHQYSKLRSLRIIGIDVVQANLDKSEHMLTKMVEHLPFEVTYMKLLNHIENLTPAVWADIQSFVQGRLLINAAFSFHHTRYPPGHHWYRTVLLQKLAMLKPAVVTLVEPSSNHDTNNLLERLRHAWQHYGAVFDLIDESLVSAQHRLSIKANFFGRELNDIFGVDDRFRCERHETYEAWVTRLTGAGLQPLRDMAPPIELPSYYNHNTTSGLTCLNYGDTTIVAVMAFAS